MPATVRQLLESAKRRLHRAPFEAPRREANLLLAHVLDCTEVRLLTHDDSEVDDGAAAAFEALISRRLTGEPVAYLVGRREFFGRSFKVDARVLIPRPETEHLISAVLSLPLPERPSILDLGTGSGCIAVTLALELAAARLLACDHSLGALAVARSNSSDLAAEPVRLVCGDWLSALDPGSLDLVVANPPYIARAEAAGISSEITAFEPHLALFGGADGLDAYRRLYESLSELRAGTPVVSEIGLDQEPAVLSLARTHGFVHQRTVKDYAGISRVVVVNRA